MTYGIIPTSCKHINSSFSSLEGETLELRIHPQVTCKHANQRCQITRVSRLNKLDRSSSRLPLAPSCPLYPSNGSPPSRPLSSLASSDSSTPHPAFLWANNGAPQCASLSAIRRNRPAQPYSSRQRATVHLLARDVCVSVCVEESPQQGIEGE